ncbi:hypothetical protein L228DRAFT_242272 [Xylona heveae TC161]|uniref:Uncharacterized protein n=1 Tax=Xylona heveae (strain CBS 132557 / TC161) TaxID=1328760 RepID=A0A165J8F9_XYLHT|nr:hypothetical protein L228DRAFT_242272 [Xylona heveae TC161]KZF25890.1 hypothetical protein L228DRAFT_242272 [Xylona heveae TC161]
MSATVQARSLASVTWLAANPPKYLGNSNQAVQQPLILYIARVPGSKDIFLTPLKPRQKVVSAEDVQSCLYYVHVDREEDELLSQPYEQTDKKKDPITPLEELQEELDELYYEFCGASSSGDQGTIQNQQRSPVKRKPVGGSANSPAPSKPSPLAPHGENQTRRPLGPRPFLSQSETSSSPLPSDSPPRIQRRPVRPLSEDNHHAAGGPLSTFTENGKDDALLSKDPRGFQDELRAAQPPSLPPRNVNAPEVAPRYPIRRSISGRPQNGISLTLIRRDPGSGSQWNVGRVTVPSVSRQSKRENLAHNIEEGNETRQSIGIEITNTGYNKFAHQDDRFASPRPSMERGLSGTIPRAAAADGSVNMPTPGDSPGNNFYRTLQLEEAEPWRQKVASVVRSNSQRNSLSLPSTYGEDPYAPRDSRSLENVVSNKNRFSHDYAREPRRDRSSSFSRSYTFLSPWNGWCRFSTGLSGGNLKCRHDLVASNTGVPISSTIVSELRFNLPSAAAAKSNLSSPTKSFLPSTMTASDASQKRSSLFSARRHRKSNSYDPSISRHLDSSSLVPADRDESERLDLSLGQELAGGGFGGKQAKLGKLIIENEGSKMLDLLVAANIGLWWKVYDRLVDPVG